MRLKKNDSVKVISGRDSGKEGTIIEISSKKGKVLVKGLGIITRHVKPRKQGEVGGIRKEESYIEMSQVMPICSSCKKPCRVIAKLENGKKNRACHRCQEIL